MSGRAEQRLRAVARDVAWPPTPDLAAAVAARVAAGGERGSRLRARVALAGAVFLAGAVAVIPPARGAVLDALGLGPAVRIVRVAREPADRPGAPLPLGRRVALDRARLLADFRVRVPAVLGPPPEVRFSAGILGGAVTLRYGERAVLTEFRGSAIAFVQKLVGPRTRLRRVAVRPGVPGVLLEGTPPVVLVADVRGRLVEGRPVLPGGRVLLWQDRALAYRLETTAGPAGALRIARSLR